MVTLNNTVYEDASPHKEVETNIIERNRKILDNKELVYYIANKYLNIYPSPSIERDDLIQAGFIGLLKGIEIFDETKGGKFSTYIYQYINAEIMRLINNMQSTIRVPVHRHEDIQRLKYIQEALKLKLGRPPSNEEITTRMDISIETLEKITHAIHISTTVNLDTEITEKDSMLSLIETIPGPNKYIRDTPDQFYKKVLTELDEGIEELHEKIVNLIDAKTSRQINHEKATSMCNILFDKFGINKDGQKQYLKTIGAKYNVTPESIRQKINRTISYIQQEDELKDPLKKISMLRRYI